MLSRKINRSNLFLLTCYTCFLVALFIEDISIFSQKLSFLVIGLKLFVSISLVVVLSFKSLKKKEFKYLIFSTLFGLLVLAISGDFFWLIIILMSYAAKDVNSDIFFKISIFEIITLSLFVLVLCFANVVPDIISYRTDFSVVARHSLGFGHSTVLPLIIFYLTAYYVMLNKEKCNYAILLAFALLSCFVYVYCDSRNGFLSTILLVISAYMLKNKIIKRYASTIIRFLAKHIAFICITFSVIPSYLRAKDILTPLWYMYDEIFTNRSLLGASAINKYGIHLLNHMTYSEYSSVVVLVDSHVWHGIVLDSAYLYVLIRYGILVLCYVWLIFQSLYKREKNSQFSCLVIIIVAIANMTDNDILSYGFLPFMIMSISNVNTYIFRKKGSWHG